MPLALVVCVRLSLVWSLTMFTVVFGRMPPDASVTVPVIPPRVCCARAGEERTNWTKPQRKEAKKKTENVFFLFLVIRNGLLNLSRYTWPIKSSQDFLGTADFLKRSSRPRHAPWTERKMLGISYSNSARSSNEIFDFC